MRFFHAADIHLGAKPDKGFPWSEERGREIWESFRRLIRQVGEEKADLLLIAGDLFHRQPLMRELKEVNFLFSSVPHTKIVLMAGNHDYLKKDSCYLRFPWNDNVYCLWGKQEPCVEFPDMGTAVYGISYDRQEIADPLYHHIKAERRQPVEILLAHGGDEKHIPFRTEALENAGFDYIALGHIHKPGILTKNRIAYSGALEPIDRNDLGTHGYIRGEILPGKGTRIQFVPAAKRTYETIIIPVDEDTTQYSLEQIISGTLDERKDNNLYCMVLQGVRSMETEFDTERLMKLGRIRYVEDTTRPFYDKKTLTRQYRGTLIEAFVREFDRENLSAEEEKAFVYGLEALLGAREE